MCKNDDVHQQLCCGGGVFVLSLVTRPTGGAGIEDAAQYNEEATGVLLPPGLRDRRPATSSSSSAIRRVSLRLRL